MLNLSDAEKRLIEAKCPCLTDEPCGRCIDGGHGAWCDCRGTSLVYPTLSRRCPAAARPLLLFEEPTLDDVRAEEENQSRCHEERCRCLGTGRIPCSTAERIVTTMEMRPQNWVVIHSTPWWEVRDPSLSLISQAEYNLA